MTLDGNGLGASVRSGTDGALKRPKDGSSLRKSSLSVAEIRSALADIRLYIGQGKRDEEIFDLISKDFGKKNVTLTTQRYNELKKELYRQETADLYGKSTEDIYLEYRWQQGECINDLNKMIATIDRGDDSKQHNALVGAIKARSEIIDKVIKVGQDMGILEKAPEKRLNIGVTAVVNLSDVDLRKKVAEELQGLKQVISKYGQRDMDGNLIGDEEPLALVAPKFTGKGRPGTATAGPAKAAAARASRVAVKRTKVIDVSAKGG